MQARGATWAAVASGSDDSCPSQRSLRAAVSCGILWEEVPDRLRIALSLRVVIRYSSRWSYVFLGQCEPFRDDRRYRERVTICRQCAIRGDQPRKGSPKPAKGVLHVHGWRFPQPALLLLLRVDHSLLANLSEATFVQVFLLLVVVVLRPASTYGGERASRGCSSIAHAGGFPSLGSACR